MSYILDALKKSQQEREIGRVPTLHSVATKGAPRLRFVPVFGISLVVIVVVAVGGMVLIWFDRTPPAEIDGVADRKGPPAPETAGGQVVVGDQPSLRSLVDDAQWRENERSAGAAVAESAALEVPYPNAVYEPKLEDLVRQHRYREVPPPVSFADVQQDSAESSENVSEALSGERYDEVPLLEELDERLRQRVPPISVDVHVYAAQPEQRFVFLNMQKYHEGDWLPGNIQVEAITRSGVVLRSDAQLFRLSKQ